MLVLKSGNRFWSLSSVSCRMIKKILEKEQKRKNIPLFRQEILEAMSLGDLEIIEKVQQEIQQFFEGEEKERLVMIEKFKKLDEALSVLDEIGPIQSSTVIELFLSCHDKEDVSDFLKQELGLVGSQLLISFQKGSEEVKKKIKKWVDSLKATQIWKTPF